MVGIIQRSWLASCRDHVEMTIQTKSATRKLRWHPTEARRYGGVMIVSFHTTGTNNSLIDGLRQGGELTVPDREGGVMHASPSPTAAWRSRAAVRVHGVPRCACMACRGACAWRAAVRVHGVRPHSESSMLSSFTSLWMTCGFFWCRCDSTAAICTPQATASAVVVPRACGQAHTQTHMSMHKSMHK
eukprot:364222-Chlamydomonas_euryale.AAC.2